MEEGFWGGVSLRPGIQYDGEVESTLEHFVPWGELRGSEDGSLCLEYNPEIIGTILGDIYDFE